jgi:hypothetical protein
VYFLIILTAADFPEINKAALFEINRYFRQDE